MTSQHHIVHRQPQQRQHAAAGFLWLLLVHQAAAGRDVLIPLKPGQYNPSLVVYEGTGWLVARSTELKWDTAGVKWILNRAHLCQVNTTDWSVVSCHDFDPWRGGYGAQCRAGSAEWKVPWEAWGVDDTKLFKWQGRGLWAITGRRPVRPIDSIYCPQPVVWRQWLVQLAPEGLQVVPHNFNYTPADPDNVTWGHKPGSSGATSATAGRRMLQRWLPTPPVAAAVPRGPLPSSTSSRYPSVGRHRHVTKRHRRRYRYKFSAAGTPLAAYAAVDEDSLIPEINPRIHHYKEHRRPGAQADEAQAMGPQQKQQQSSSTASALPLLLPSATPAAIAPTATGQTYVAATNQSQQVQASPNILGVQQQQSAREPDGDSPQKSQRPATSDDAQTASVGPDKPQSATSKSINKAGQISGGGAGDTHGKAVGTIYGTVPGQPDSWDCYWGHRPVSLAIADGKAVYGHDHSVSEKNWMPFVWQGQLYVTYQLMPKHRVYLLHPNGTAQPAYATDPGAAFQGLGSSAARLHGGPPLVYVNYPSHLVSVRSPGIQAATARQGPYYLGVAHYWLPAGGGDGRTYHHFLIKVEPEPPFRILQVSAELRLQYNQHYKRVAFVSGIDLAALPAGTGADASSSSSNGKQLDNQQLLSTEQADDGGQQWRSQPHVVISYGSGDWQSRVLLMMLDDVEELFIQGSSNAGPAGSNSSSISVQSASSPTDRGTGYHHDNKEQDK